MKALETMALKSLSLECEPVSLEAFGLEVLRRRAAAGDPVVPRNAGGNRTASKRALLKAIEDAGGRGDRWPSASFASDRLRMSGLKGYSSPRA